MLQPVKKKTRGIIKSSECDIFRPIKVTRHYYMRPTRYKCNIILSYYIGNRLYDNVSLYKKDLKYEYKKGMIIDVYYNPKNHNDIQLLPDYNKIIGMCCIILSLFIILITIL